VSRKLIVILGLIALAGGGIAYWILSHEADPNDLTLYGNVEVRQVNLGFRVSGRVATLHVDEGDRVENGAVLAALDPVPYQQELALAQAELEAQRANLEKLQHGTRVEEIAQARARVNEAEAERERLAKEFQRARQLRQQNLNSQSDFDLALATRNESEARLASAKAQLDMNLAGARIEDVAAASARYRAAEVRAAQAQTRLEDSEIRAPANGVIITRVVEPGAIVAAGATILTLSLESPVWVRTYVPEPHLGQIREGMRVTVLSDSGARLPGQVGFISPDAEFTPKSVQTPELRTDLVYRLRVVVKDPRRVLRRGMPVSVELEPEAVTTDG
jgi:HlyD family secretion protein